MISKIQPHRFSSKHAVKVTKIERFKFKFEVALTHFGALLSYEVPTVKVLDIIESESIEHEIVRRDLLLYDTSIKRNKIMQRSQCERQSHFIKD